MWELVTCTRSHMQLTFDSAAMCCASDHGYQFAYGSATHPAGKNSDGRLRCDPELLRNWLQRSRFLVCWRTAYLQSPKCWMMRRVKKKRNRNPCTVINLETT
ncbi:unnamed protein product [Ectocarpus sp. 12 AP-2014]